MDDLQKTLSNLLDQVMSDPQLEADDKEDLVALINDVVADPTPNNLDALALVIDELGKSQEYLAAKDIMANYEAGNEEEVVPAEVAQEAEVQTAAPEPVQEAVAPAADLTAPAGPVINTHDTMSQSEMPQVPPMQIPTDTPPQQ